MISVALLVVGLQGPATPQSQPRGNPICWETLFRLPKLYWSVVGIGALFTLARFSEAFLVLRSQERGIPMAFAPLVMVVMNVVYACSAYPFGHLADRMRHATLIIWGLLILIAADLVLAMSNHWSLVLIGGHAVGHAHGDDPRAPRHDGRRHRSG